MRKNWIVVPCVPIVLLFVCSLSCFGQVATGTPPLGSFGGGPDVIDLANLNAHLTVPVINKAGRGLPFSYNLTYDSSIWYPVTSGSTTTWQPVNYWGWGVQTAVATGYLNTRTVTTTCFTSHTPTGIKEVFSNWTYTDQFGVVHAFPGSSEIETGTCGSTIINMNSVATDNSGYTLTTTNGAGNPTIVSRAGTVTNPPFQTGYGASTVTDSNGNQISVGLTTAGVFTDTLGQTALTISQDAPGPSTPTTFTYAAPSGSNVAYKMQYTNYTIQTNFGCSGVGEYSVSNVPLVTEIDLPDSTKYLFTYETTPSNPTNRTGRLASVTLPTGGTITYAYSGGTGTGNSGIICADGSSATLTRTTPDTGASPWTYAHSESGTAWTTTIEDPQANKTVMNFQGIYPTERQVYQGASTLLKTLTTCYNGNTANCNSTAIALPITQKTVFREWPGGLESRSDDFYNAYGLVTERDEYDYGSGSPGVLKRKTLTAYATLSNGIYNAPASVTVQDGAGNVKSQTTYAYDQGTPVSTGGTPQHISISGSHGNATTINSLVGGSTFLTSTYTYFDTGNVNVATDVNGANTVYVSAGCGNSFETGVNEPGLLFRSMTWNCVGGVEISVTDENSQVTSKTYTDPNFWRPNAITDEESNVTTLTYTGATSVESSLPFDTPASPTATSDALITLDSLGRPQVSQRKQGPSLTTYDSQETTYNSVGLPLKTTLPYPGIAGATNSAAPGVSSTYDTLGRVVQTSDSGGGTTAYSYNQNDVLVTSGPAPAGENVKSKQYEHDALGRLTSVCEITAGTTSWPGGSCGQTTAATGYLTKYSYDLNNNLVSVTLNAQSSTTQTRTYAYDALNRLVSEQNPESTSSTLYVYDSDSTCGTSAGDLVKKTDAVGNVICYTYDGLHRLTSTAYPSGPYAASTPNKYFVYDSATVNGVAMANAKTRMAEAYTATSPTGTKITDLGFTYSVRGEVAAVYEMTPHSGGYYQMTATYWANGSLDQIGGIPTLPTLTYTPDGEGRPAIVSASAGQNPVISTTYNNASQPLTMTLGSSDSDSFTYDTNTDRTTQFQTTVDSHSLTATLGWNAVGTPNSLNISDAFNSVDTQNCSIGHDDLARITAVNCGTVWGQNFIYDPFGNIDKSVISGDSGVSFQPTYSPTTNRIATLPGFTPTYDLNGDLLTDSAHTYTWNSEARPVTIDSTALIYDALNRMVEQSTGGTFRQIVYDPLGDKFALMSGQTLNKAFAPLPNGGIAAYTSTGLEYYRHPDWLGSSRLASTPTQGIYSDTAYAPFGEPYAQSGVSDPSFTGQNQDTTSNLYDFMYRELSPIQGRWISPDPAGLTAADPTEPRSWNRYVYAVNSPALFVDPLGLDECPPGTPDHTICVITSQPGGGGDPGVGSVDPGDPGLPDSGPGSGTPQLICAIKVAKASSPAAALKVQNVPVVSDLLGNSAADAAELALDAYNAANGSLPAFQRAVASVWEGRVTDGLSSLFTASVVFRNKLIAKSINRGFSPRTNLTKQFAKAVGRGKLAGDALVFIAAYYYSCAALAQ